MEKIRIAFEQPPQIFADKEVTITFRCRIAACLAVRTSTEMHQVDDDALCQSGNGDVTA